MNHLAFLFYIQFFRGAARTNLLILIRIDLVQRRTFFADPAMVTQTFLQIGIPDQAGFLHIPDTAAIPQVNNPVMGTFAPEQWIAPAESRRPDAFIRFSDSLAHAAGFDIEGYRLADLPENLQHVFHIILRVMFRKERSSGAGAGQGIQRFPLLGSVREIGARNLPQNAHGADGFSAHVLPQLLEYSGGILMPPQQHVIRLKPADQIPERLDGVRRFQDFLAVPVCKGNILKFGVFLERRPDPRIKTVSAFQRIRNPQSRQLGRSPMFNAIP